MLYRACFSPRVHISSAGISNNDSSRAYLSSSTYRFEEMFNLIFDFSRMCCTLFIHNLDRRRRMNPGAGAVGNEKNVNKTQLHPL